MIVVNVCRAPSNVTEERLISKMWKERPVWCPLFEVKDWREI